MSVEDYAKEAIGGQVKNIKQKIIKTILPFIIKGAAIFLVLIIIIVAIQAVVISALGLEATTYSSSGSASSGMSSFASTPSDSSWEQYKRYVISMEGGTRVNADGIVDENGEFYIVEDDWAGNPTVGHGLCLESDGSYLHVDDFNPYSIDTKELVRKYYEAVSAGYNSKTKAHSKYFPRVSVQICDEIWDKHLREKYESRVSLYKKLNLKEYQYYALTDVSYRRGNTDGFETAYKNKWSTSDDQYHKDTSSEAYSESTLYSFFWNGGHSKEGVNKRKKNQWLLFKYGYYKPLNEYWEGLTGNPGEVGKVTVRGTQIQTYTSSAGATHILYDQGVGPWKSVGYATGTIGSVGCPTAAGATILSGLGYEIYPDDLTSMYGTGVYKVMRNKGLNVEVTETNLTGEVPADHKNKIIGYLKQGKAVLFHVYGPGKGGSNKFSRNQHWMAILDTNSDGSQVYLACGSMGNPGWYDTNIVLKSLRSYAAVYK